MTLNIDTMSRIAQFMTQIADSDGFPEHDRQYWLDVCCQPEFVEQMFVHIANHYDSNDMGMCKLLDIVDNHLAKELK